VQQSRSIASVVAVLVILLGAEASQEDATTFFAHANTSVKAPLAPPREPNGITIDRSGRPRRGWRQDQSDHKDGQKTLAARNSALQTRYCI